MRHGRYAMLPHKSSQPRKGEWRSLNPWSSYCLNSETMKVHVAGAVSSNKSLQRSGTHKVLGRGRPSKSAHERWRARVLRWRRAAAELGRYAHC
jgi:hypothetical protein